MEQRFLSPETLAAPALGEARPGLGGLASVINLLANHGQQTMAPNLAPKPGGRDRGEATMNVWPEGRASGRSADLQPCEILPNTWGTNRV